MPSVFTRLPSACVTTAYSPWPLRVPPAFTQADCTPARQWAQLLSQWTNGTMTKSPGRKSRTSRPTSSTTPTHSWPIVAPGVMSLSPRYGHRSDPQMLPATTFTMASVGADSTGSGTSLSRMSPGAWMVVARMAVILSLDFGSDLRRRPRPHDP